MDKIFRRLIDTDFSELRGTSLKASVPVPQALINEVVAATLKGNKNIAALQVTVQPQNRLALDVKTTLLPWPINLKLKLDSSVDFASYSSPKLRAWMENNRLLGSLGALFNAMPPGIKLYGNQVVIDLAAFLRTPQQKKYLDMVKSVGIQTESGKVILDVRMEIR